MKSRFKFIIVEGTPCGQSEDPESFHTIQNKDVGLGKLSLYSVDPRLSFS